MPLTKSHPTNTARIGCVRLMNQRSGVQSLCAHRVCPHLASDLEIEIVEYEAFAPKPGEPGTFDFVVKVVNGGDTLQGVGIDNQRRSRRTQRKDSAPHYTYDCPYSWDSTSPTRTKTAISR